MKFFGCIFLYMTMVMAVAGCAPSRNIITPNQTISLPSSTQTSTIKATHLNPTATPTSTPTPFVTLEPEIASATLEPLLRDPLNCSEPCFWGIIPGEADFEEAKLFFNRLGFIPFEGTDDGFGRQFYTISYETKNSEDSYVTFSALSNKVIGIKITPRIIRQEEGTKREWIAYSPETLIKKFGQPSRVELYLSWLGGGSEINMTMYFDELDFVVDYAGDNMLPAGNSSPGLCPLTAPFNFVRLWLGRRPTGIPLSGVPLEEATSLTIDQFSQLMLGDPEQACFVVNGDVFP